MIADVEEDVDVSRSDNAAVAVADLKVFSLSRIVKSSFDQTSS